MNPRPLLLALFSFAVALPLPASSPTPSETDKQAIRALYDQYSAAIAAKDLAAVMSFYAPDVVAFDAYPPRQYAGATAYAQAYEDFFAAYPGPAKSEILSVVVTTGGELAFAHGVDRWVVTGKDGQSLEVVFRFTNVFKKIDGKWLIVHEHISFPVDPVSGQADFLSRP